MQEEGFLRNKFGFPAAVEFENRDVAVVPSLQPDVPFLSRWDRVPDDEQTNARLAAHFAHLGRVPHRDHTMSCRFEQRLPRIRKLRVV